MPSDFVARTGSGPPGPEPPHRCGSFLPEHPRTFHPHVGASSCKVEKEMVVLLPPPPIQQKLRLIMHVLINKQFNYSKMKKLKTLTIFRETPACGICPEVWCNGKLPSSSGSREIVDRANIVRRNPIGLQACPNHLADVSGFYSIPLIHPLLFPLGNIVLKTERHLIV